MRDAFVRELALLGAEDPRVFALAADVGVDLFDDFEARAPGRFLNVGVMEAAMVGVAAGLAYAGKVPFAYTIAPFLASRAHDQVRVDVACTGANVKLVGVGAGIAYGYLGPTHHAIEDIAVMRALPGMNVFTPGDPLEAGQAARAALALDGPVYLRLGKNGEQRVLGDDHRFTPGRATWLRTGPDVTIATAGTTLPIAIEAADALATRGVKASVLHFGTVKPLDGHAIVAALRRTGTIVTIEEHTILGGFGGAVAEVAASSGVRGIVRRLGIPDSFAHEVGSQKHLMRHFGMDAEAVCATVDALLGRRAA
jgi:transketolase